VFHGHEATVSPNRKIARAPLAAVVCDHCSWAYKEGLGTPDKPFY